MVTIFDVAKEAGVSKSTVSRVINRDTKVKQETRDAVEAAIKKLNYSPSYMAQAIRTRKTHTIALVVPEYSNIFYTEMFRGVEDIALKYGYMVMVCNTERHAMSEIEYTNELLKRNIDGIIYNTYRTDDEMADYLRQISERLPIVYMNRIFGDDENYACVYTDGFKSNRKAVQYLIDKGKHKLGYVMNSEDVSIIEERFEGFVQGLKDHGLELNEKWVYRVQRENEPDYIKLGRDAAKYYASLKDRPDAILTATDMLAIGCVKGFNESKIKVPDEISVIGFDNVFVSALIDPPLTTIAQPVRKMGQAAAEILISSLQGKKIQNKVVFDGKLIVRETT
nr:LacI family DNA-binding transcriptional regulator [uncultured Blautia sp.]